MTADDPRHGTQNGYNNLRCRCDPCRSAHAAYFREVGSAGHAGRERYRDKLTAAGWLRSGAGRLKT